MASLFLAIPIIPLQQKLIWQFASYKSMVTVILLTFQVFLRSWTIYSNINSRYLTSARRPIILWLLLPCSQFLKIGKIVFLSSHHLSSRKLLDLSLEAHLSGIFSGKILGEKLRSFTDDWHCKHKTLGNKREKILEQKYNRRKTCRQKYTTQFLTTDQE